MLSFFSYCDLVSTLFSLIFLTLGIAETILIPEDYTTIQAGIDASVDGDTVLVADGDYVENIVLDKSIVLTSYAIYDNLDEWIIFDDYFFNQADNIFFLLRKLPCSLVKYAMLLNDNKATLEYFKNINGLYINLDTSYDLFSQVPDYEMSLKISSKF